MKVQKPSDISSQNLNIPLIHARISHTPINKESIEALTPETDRKVTGVFVNVEYPGQTAKVCARLYKGMQYFCRVFEDNERVTIPLSVARMINERIGYEVHSHILDDKGNPIKGVKLKCRYKFMAEF
jgi:hypothetical protein